jgi:hypothetical protein
MPARYPVVLVAAFLLAAAALWAVMLLVSSTAHAGWTEQTVTSTNMLSVVDAVDENVVWAVGDDRQVFRTIDGGANWILRSTPSGNHSAVWAFDADRCVVAGASGIFWRTTDGGLTWTDVHHAGTFIDGIHFFDSLNGWAIGDPVAGQWVIRQTTDGGASWSPAPAPPTAQGGGITRSLSWIGTQIGVFGTSQSVVWRTTDGGQNWTAITTSSQQVAGLVLDASAIGLVGGDLDIYERSTDQGATWQVLSNPALGRLLTFDWIDGTSEVWGSTSQSGLFHSTDLGLSWNQHTLGPAYVAEDLDFANSNFGWSVGWRGSNHAGRIWRYSATTGVDASGSGSVTALQVETAPNPFSNAVRFTMRGAELGPAALRIFDVAGREVALLRPNSPGEVALRWDGRNRGGKPVAAGTYFWQLDVPGSRAEGKVVRTTP